MKILVEKTSLSLVLRWAQRTLFTSAFLTLGYCAFVGMDRWIFQHQGQQDFEALLQHQHHGQVPPEFGPDGLLGRIEILRLGVSVLVVEGTGEQGLQRAAGHIKGTSMPGQPGNVGIAGHRDSFFRPLRNIRNDDVITLATLRGEYRYRVVSTKIVTPEDIAVLDPDGNEILTLVTCYPFYFVGSAPNRFIVRAQRVS